MAVNVTLDDPWLTIDLGQDCETFGWTYRHGGMGQSRKIAWRAVRNEDLGEDFDIDPWLAAQTAARDLQDAPCFLTSARIADFAQASRSVAGISAHAVATAGLGNAERIGTRLMPEAHPGTINVLVAVDCPLSLPAKIELVSLITEARTTAMLARGHLVATGMATGTGTDCICVASPAGPAPITMAGKHTALGEAVGAAACAALSEAITRWRDPRDG